MPHFRLRKADDLDGQVLECDQPTTEMALLFFGHQLKSVLALDGDVIDYVLESRPSEEPNFKKSHQMVVRVLR